MPVNRSTLAGWSVLTLLAYCTLGAAVYFISLLALERGTLLHFPWVTAAQQSLYRAGLGIGHGTWLRPECIDYDPDLIYLPRIGTCSFDDVEFRTTLAFTDTGRDTGARPSGPGIALLGDSHAMGWGVNDQETFAARLQQLSGRPVYNLGVASYGTVRELLRLEKSGLAQRVDTVIIQYCNNDLAENARFDPAGNRQRYDNIVAQFSRPAARTGSGRAGDIARGYWYTLKAPFKLLAERLRRKNFSRHYAALQSVIAAHQAVLAGKRVVVFYSNSHGQQYRNFPAGTDSALPNVQFVDLGLDYSNYYLLDNHLTPAGNAVVAERLYRVLQEASHQGSPR